jgi:hypothetical protein
VTEALLHSPDVYALLIGLRNGKPEPHVGLPVGQLSAEDRYISILVVHTTSGRQGGMPLPFGSRHSCKTILALPS